VAVGNRVTVRLGTKYVPMVTSREVPELSRTTGREDGCVVFITGSLKVITMDRKGRGGYKG